MIRKLRKICKDHENPLFKAYARLGDKTFTEFTPVSSRYNLEYTKSNINEPIEQVFISGPPKMLLELPQDLKQFRIDEERIMIV